MAVGQLRDEGGQLRRLDPLGFELVPGEEFAVLQEIGAVGLERIPGETPLELQVGQKVEHELVEARGSRESFNGRHNDVFVPAHGPPAG